MPRTAGSFSGGVMLYQAMDDPLQPETEKLVRTWMQYDAAMLRDYLVAGVEDPRLNVQSILARHFLAGELFPGRFAGLMEAEIQFATVMNWLLPLLRRGADPEELGLIRHALLEQADNAEGVELPYLPLERSQSR